MWRPELPSPLIFLILHILRCRSITHTSITFKRRRARELRFPIGTVEGSRRAVVSNTNHTLHRSFSYGCLHWCGLCVDQQASSETSTIGHDLTDIAHSATSTPTQSMRGLCILSVSYSYLLHAFLDLQHHVQLSEGVLIVS